MLLITLEQVAFHHRCTITYQINSSHLIRIGSLIINTCHSYFLRKFCVWHDATDLVQDASIY